MVLVAVVLGAAPAGDADLFLREGDQAFVRGDFEVALQLYGQAEKRTTNPGRVAAHQAAALYRLGQFGEAENAYRCALEDATGARRAALLYDLGNCFLQRSGNTKLRARDRLKLFADAVASYQACLRQPGAEPELLADVRHNLELTRLLWGQARQERNDSEHGSDPNDPKNDPPEMKKPPPGPDGSEPGVGPKPGPDDKGGKVEPGAQQTPQPTPDQAPPGKGNTRALPDDETSPLLSPEEAARHLEMATEKIHARRRGDLQRTVPANPKGRIW
jgi:tetratricopeptide (TPR) repeat protein